MGVRLFPLTPPIVPRIPEIDFINDTVLVFEVRDIKK